MNDDKCYSGHAEVPLVNALDECRAELAKLKEGAKVIAEALSKCVNAIQRVASINDQTRLGWALKDADSAMDIAREHGLLEEK